RNKPKQLAGSVREKILLDYSSYMARFVMSESCSLTPSPTHSEPGSPTDTRKLSCDPISGQGESRPAWINALIGRIFWDFLREKYWADQVAHKIQKKLTKIRLPYFMNELTLAELDMGTCMPQVLSTSKPSVDRRAIWNHPTYLLRLVRIPVMQLAFSQH
uniref:SMP-LTD domain-containing protein n=1 Tax=Astyanax mexicanus TaxID=7994 RepID=A0A3B1IEK4_ASTMX